MSDVVSSSIIAGTVVAASGNDNSARASPGRLFRRQFGAMICLK
jgi:hypothetical protein